MNLKDAIFIGSQYLLPQHSLSRLVGWFAQTRIGWIKTPLIKLFIKAFGVDLSIAERQQVEDYQDFNDFFTRKLLDGQRPLDTSEAVVLCPADGAISQIGQMEQDSLLQAKGQTYDLQALLGGNVEMAQRYHNGHFATVYLSPKDYHRVHMPLDGTLRETLYIPGDLFSVNQTTAQNVPNLFARNERLVCEFDTPAGPMVVILVGAMIVAGIETVWSGPVAPLKPRLQRQQFNQLPEPVSLKQGDELACFKLGSTAIVLLGENTVQWREDWQAGSATLMGEKMGELVSV